MIGETSTHQVYLACGSTDMRKSIDGLAALVQLSFRLDPFSSCLFVFCNRGQDKLKILQWDHNGFWLHYRRLERGRFQWPAGKTAVAVSYREFRWLLDGLPLTQKQAHEEVRLRSAI